MSVGEDRQTVDVVGVTVVHLHTLSRHHPAPDAGVVTTGEELHITHHRQATHTVLMTWEGRERERERERERQ